MLGMPPVSAAIAYICVEAPAYLPLLAVSVRTGARL